MTFERWMRTMYPDYYEKYVNNTLPLSIVSEIREEYEIELENK